MGLFSSIIGAAAPVVGGIFGGPVGSAIGGAVGGLVAGKGGSSQSGTATSTTQQQLDPRIQSMLFGDGTDGNKGLLSQYQQLGQQPQSAGSATFGNAAQNFIGANGGGLLSQIQTGAGNLAGSNISAPASSAAQVQNPAAVVAAQSNAANAVNPAYAQGANMVSAQSQGTQIKDPKQNQMDLSGAYNATINGDAGANPYLTNALKAGVDATNAGYNRNLSSLTDTLQKQILPGIRSNSVLAGQVGGSRQGIAEGNALSDFTKQATDANLQLGLANSANTLGAQASAFNAGQDRSLSALQNLSGQQYGVASQNAALGQQNNISNAQLQNQTGIQVSSNNQQANLANAGYAQQAALANQSAQQQTNLANAGLSQQANLANQNAQQQTIAQNGQNQQQTNLANMQAQLGTNSLNSANQATGLQAQSGLLSNASGYATNQDNYAINKAQQVNGLLAPYLSANGSSSTSSPLYSNTGANILGGAAAGLGLYNQFNQLGSGGGGGGNSITPQNPNAQNVLPSNYWGADIMSGYK